MQIEPVLPSSRQLDLLGVAALRRMEQDAAAALPPHTLMQRAGLSVARLAQALAPHARRICVLAGPGNNGGDGLEAAMHLLRAGRQVQVLLVTDTGPAALPPDAARSLRRAQQAGALIDDSLPATLDADLLVDALLGIGARRAPAGRIAAAISLAGRHRGPLLAVDLPSGLHAETGQRLGEQAVRATDTLSLLALKPGLFTGMGRELCGRIWHDDIGTADLLRAADEAPLARLAPSQPRAGRSARQHAQHKGSFGDLVVIGGATGMTGAARLAGRGGLAAGAGRVYLSLLDGDSQGGDEGRPELMQRPALWADEAGLLGRATVVCGCGGGQAVAEAMPAVLAHAPRLVLDADALNAVAAQPALQQALAGRARRGRHTVLTPHPLEAARLLGSSAAAIQADRLNAAVQIAARFDAVVVLKGSGTVLAAPGRLPLVNATGNALLATAGTGDVLAGWLGGRWAQEPQDSGWQPAVDAVRRHGAAADSASTAGLDGPLRAADLVEAMLSLR